MITIMTPKSSQKDNSALPEYNLFFRILYIISVSIGIILCLITILISLCYCSTCCYSGCPHSKITEHNKNGTNLKIISRAEWGAEPPKELNPLVTPVSNVIILHTATEACMSQDKCALITQYIQYFHMESREWEDIAYSFLVGGDGQIYEGRGWKNIGIFAHVWNPKSIGIGFIGTFINKLPPKQQILAAKMLIKKGVEEGYIAEDYKLLAHRQVSRTESPGNVLYEDIQTWPHWTNESHISSEINL